MSNFKHSKGNIKPKHFVNMDSFKGKLNTVHRDLKLIIESYDIFIELYNMSKKDKLLSNAGSLEFIASFNELDHTITTLSFISFVDKKQFTPNPCLSEFYCPYCEHGYLEPDYDKCPNCEKSNPLREGGCI